MSFFRSASRSHAPAVCAQRSAAWHRSPLYARMCVLGLRSSLTTGLGSYPPTSAPGPSPPPTHICTGTESIPYPPLHCERVHPRRPTSAPQPNQSPADICVTAAALRDIRLCATQAWRGSAAHCVATTCAVLQPSATCAQSRCGRRMLQPAAALPCCWLHPIRSKRSEAKAPPAESRGVCAAQWTRIGFDVSAAVPFTAPSIIRSESTCHWQ